MRSLPRLALAALVALAMLSIAGPAGAATPRARAGSSRPPPERFIAGTDVEFVFVAPTLRDLSLQSAEALALAATFPGGAKLAERYASFRAQLGFDLLDPASLARAGLDPAGAAAAAFAKVDEREHPSARLALPVGDEAALRATLTRIARTEPRHTSRTSQVGGTRVTTWTFGKGDGMAWAITERTLLLGVGDHPTDEVRAALQMSRGAHLGTNPDFRTTARCMGPGLGLLAFYPPGSRVFRNNSEAKAMTVGLNVTRERLAFVVCMVPKTPRSAPEPGEGDSAALVSKLDPGASWVLRSDLRVASNDLLTSATAGLQGDEVNRVLLDAARGAGNGFAFGLGLVPVTSSADGPRLDKAPLAFFRAELLVALDDPSAMRSAVRQLMRQVAHGSVELPEEGPWVLPLPGGEIAAAVTDDRLLVTAGPAGSLQALQSRDGSSFQPPTTLSSRSFQRGVGGMYVDVPKLAATVKAIPASAYARYGEEAYEQVQRWADVASRFSAVSAYAEFVPGAQRVELTVEVAPPEQE